MAISMTSDPLVGSLGDPQVTCQQSESFTDSPLPSYPSECGGASPSLPPLFSVSSFGTAPPYFHRLVAVAGYPFTKVVRHPLDRDTRHGRAIARTRATTPVPQQCRLLVCSADHTSLTAHEDRRQGKKVLHWRSHSTSTTCSLRWMRRYPPDALTRPRNRCITGYRTRRRRTYDDNDGNHGYRGTAADQWHLPTRRIDPAATPPDPRYSRGI